MESEKYYIKISPGVLKDDIISETYDGSTFGVYTGMTQLLSGGTNGDSILTGLTIPVLFKDSFNDLGYYTPFDGYILQKEVVNNFLYSADSSNNYTIYVYNTSDTEFKSFLQLSNYILDWGDGSPTQTINETSPSYLSHTYTFASDFTITLTQNNPWGITQVSKTISVPYTGATIPNPLGEITFTPQGGSWAGTPLSYDYIFTGDSENIASEQVSSTWTSVPFTVSGYTTSQIKDLQQYGSIKYAVNVPILKNGQIYGLINEMTPMYTGYTINNVDYYDYVDGTTVFFVSSSGLTENELVTSGITKQEVLLDFVSSPEIQSQIFIDRGKLSAYEALQRLGEVDNIGDLVRYGYGFFKINNT